LILTQLTEPEWIFPFDAMSVGDSFFVPTLKPAPMIYALESGAKRAGVKVKAFVTVKDECLGVRAWRIA
jgi:beta-phosphoglucomutase-like phosphatase (HAD superfamily)